MNITLFSIYNSYFDIPLSCADACAERIAAGCHGIPATGAGGSVTLQEERVVAP